MDRDRLRSEHEYTLRISNLQQRIYAEYMTYVADQDHFLFVNRHAPHEISEMFPCGESDIIRSFRMYQKCRNAFLHSPLLRSETHALKTREEWLACSEKLHYTFHLYLWIRNHEVITIRHFFNAHSIFALPQ